MIYYRNTKDIRADASVVTLGKFDGLHIGHRKLLEEMRRQKSEALPGVMFTFDQKDFRSRSILTEEERREKAALLGVDIFVDWPFDDETRSMEPERFVREILCGRLGAKLLIVGTDFRFGHDRAGDVETLKHFSEKYGYEVEVIEKVTYQGQEVSSTRIRDAVSKGQMEDVTAMLSEPLSLSGEIVRGTRIGTSIGVPTINLKPNEEKLLPPYGVYVSTAEVDGITYPSISDLGVKPSVSDENEPGLETHLLFHDEDLYGKRALIRLVHFLRAEQKFDSPEALKKQIRRDCESARQYFEYD